MPESVGMKKDPKMRPVDDIRVEALRPLLPPTILLEELPITEAIGQTVVDGRRQIREILEGKDDRLLVVVGPCSIHDPGAGLEYAERLARVSERLAGELCVVMRVYFEKPRTTVGWKGLINDPGLDNTFHINTGLRLARRFLLDVIGQGVPAGCEFLDPITPQFLADLVSWGAIGARTTESQVHRELASGLSMPVGFKNGTGGTVQLAVDAVRSAAFPHSFLGVTKQGLAAIVATTGNPHCHVILRGGKTGPNYGEDAIEAVERQLDAGGLPRRIMVDCSHANSGKDHTVQPSVAAEVAAQIGDGRQSIFGVMLESFLLAGKQKVEAGAELVHGQSITDACMGWETSVKVLEGLAAAVGRRRKGARRA